MKDDGLRMKRKQHRAKGIEQIKKVDKLISK